MADGIAAEDSFKTLVMPYPLRMTREMYQQMKAAAGRRDMPMSVWLRDAIREKLERDHAQHRG